jgi:hypothetical protein
VEFGHFFSPNAEALQGIMDVEVSHFCQVNGHVDGVARTTTATITGNHCGTR